jgi:hypothetical protein
MFREANGVDRMSGSSGRAVILLAAFGLFLTLSACDDATGPARGTNRGILEFSAGTASTAAQTSVPETLSGSIEAPDTVQAGESFPVTVRTVGLDGCWEPVMEDVSVSGLVADVIPFDSAEAPEGAACTAALELLDHGFSLTFDEPGEATIRVEGRRVVGRDFEEVEPISMEEQVTVVE